MVFPLSKAAVVCLKKVKRWLHRRARMVQLTALLILVLIICHGAPSMFSDAHKPRRILVDTDVDADDVFALFYLLKQSRREFNLQAITISANAWSDPGHAVNNVYEILSMMGRDDIPVGVGGEGGILPNGTILPDVGGYLPIIDQGMSTVGECRYRQAIPLGQRGRLDVNTNYGLRKAFLPKGDRHYIPLKQTTTQKVMIDAISAGPVTVFLMGSHTNFAIFLMNNPHLKKNVERVYAMGGSIRSSCSKNANSTEPEQCGVLGNLYPEDSNPYAEYNIFSDPFASYLVLHSGIPITLIPLDATNTIPVSESFLAEFERRQNTNEAFYCFQSLKMIHDTWPGDQFHQLYCMWDSFMAGVALSIMRNSDSQHGENEFAEMEYVNITVVTSNEPYGTSDGSNPLIEGLAPTKLNIQKNGVHTGHVQMGMSDPFCLKNEKDRCQDGYTKEIIGQEGVRVLVATRAKPSKITGSLLDRAFYKDYLDVINSPEQTGRYSIRAQFPYYKDIIYKPDFKGKSMGKPFVFDMDMSTGDILTLLYLLKLPVELINLKGILISSTGWATSATVDVVYDILHMMGRDDIPVGLGDAYAVGEAEPTYPAIGGCKYAKAIPHGAGGLLDSDTLYGLAHDLPRSPRRYTAENSMRFGAPRDTDHPELRQPLALDVWESIVKSLDPGSKITVLTNGPLTNIAQIILSNNSSTLIQDVYIVGGHICRDGEKGNLFTIPSNKYAEFNMFLDPLAAKTILESKLNIILIPLGAQRRVSSFTDMLDKLQVQNRTPEALFSGRLLSTLMQLQRKHNSYHHVDIFLGEILGAVVLAGDPRLNLTFESRPLKIVTDADISKIGQIVIDGKQGKLVKILESLNPAIYYDHFVKVLGESWQSAVMGELQEQKAIWSRDPNNGR